MFVVWMTGTWFEQAAGVPAGLRVVPVVDRVCDGRDARARGRDRDRPMTYEEHAKQLLRAADSAPDEKMAQAVATMAVACALLALLEELRRAK